MTIKEQIIEIIRGEGFDFITACSMADECIREFKESGKQAQRYYIGKKEFTIGCERIESIVESIGVKDSGISGTQKKQRPKKRRRMF